MTDSIIKNLLIEDENNTEVFRERLLRSLKLSSFSFIVLLSLVYYINYNSYLNNGLPSSYSSQIFHSNLFACL